MYLYIYIYALKSLLLHSRDIGLLQRFKRIEVYKFHKFHSVDNHNSRQKKFSSTNLYSVAALRVIVDFISPFRTKNRFECCNKPRCGIINVVE